MPSGPARLVNLVSPRLKVEPIDAWRWNYIKKPRRPRAVEHILSAGLTSGDLIDLNVLELAKLDDVGFLTSLGNALEAAVNHGLDIARRLGWDATRRFRGLGSLNRAYYTQPARRGGVDDEPDAYNRGIAPTVKLLHAVVTKISEHDLAAARDFTRRWKLGFSPVHLRLWAAMSRNEQISPTGEVSAFLTFSIKSGFGMCMASRR